MSVEIVKSIPHAKARDVNIIVSSGIVGVCGANLIEEPQATSQWLENIFAFLVFHYPNKKIHCKMVYGIR